MPFDLPFATVDRLAAFLLVFMRMTGLMVAAPLLSNQVFPMQLRIWLSFLLAAIAFPVAAQTGTDGAFAALFRQPAGAAIAVAGEIAIGYAIGWVAALVVWIGELMGHIIGQEIGYSLADVFDPVSEIQGSPTTQLFFLISLMAFMLLNGHHAAIFAITKSFQAAPPGAFPFHYSDGMFMAKDLGSEVWSMGARMALPVIIALFLVTVATGILARAVPEMNVFIIGMALRVFFGLLAVIAVLPFVGDMFREIVLGIEPHLGRLLSSWSGVTHGG